MQFLTNILEHPVLFVILLMFVMGFVGMTYDFILKLFGKKPLHFFNYSTDYEKDEGKNNEPPEPANVPKPPAPPSDTLKGAEEIPDGAEELENEDGTTTVEYTYDDTGSG